MTGALIVFFGVLGIVLGVFLREALSETVCWKCQRPVGRNFYMEGLRTVCKRCHEKGRVI